MIGVRTAGAVPTINRQPFSSRSHNFWRPDSNCAAAIDFDVAGPFLYFGLMPVIKIAGLNAAIAGFIDGASLMAVLPTRESLRLGPDLETRGLRLSILARVTARSTGLSAAAPTPVALVYL